MQNMLYIDKEFQNSIGGDKNRSKYLYNTLENKSHLFSCIIKDTKENVMQNSDIEIVSLKHKQLFLPQAIADFSQESLERFLQFIKDNNIQTLFFRTIAFSALAMYAKSKLESLNIIIDADLVLSRLMHQAWEKNKSLSSRYYFLQSLKLSLYEKKLYQQNFTFLFTNQEECLSIKEKYPNTTIKYLTNTTNLEIRKPLARESKVILFYGTMTSTANIDAYNYICDELYDAIKEDLELNNYEIHIVGKGCETLKPSKYKRIKLIGKVDSIEKTLLQSAFVILPLFIASGTNTRVIESAMSGSPLLTSSLGGEGLLKYNNDYICDTTEDMRKCIHNLIHDKSYSLKIAQKIQIQVVDQFSYSNFDKNLSLILEESSQEKIPLMHVPRRFTQKSWGGTETVVVNSANNLAALGYESSIYTSKALDAQSMDSIDSVVIRRFNYFYPFFGLSAKQKNAFDAIGGNLFSFSLMFALLKNKDIKLIHLHTLKRMGAIVRTVARLKKIPYVITLHGGYFSIDSGEVQHRSEQLKNGYEWGKILGYLFGSRKVMDDASAIITLSKEEYDATYKKYPEKTHYLSNGVDVDKFSIKGTVTFKSVYNIDVDSKMILCSARIDPQKNQLLLLEVYNKLRVKNKNLHLVLLGTVSDRDYYQKIKNFIKENSLENSVSFVQNLTPKDQLLVDAYSEAELLVLASRHEPFGMVILEAWAAKTPVVASCTGGIQKIITHNSNGLLFKNGDKDDLYSNIQNVLESSVLKQHLIANASIDVQKYDWRNIVKDLDVIYKNTLKSA